MSTPTIPQSDPTPTTPTPTPPAAAAARNGFGVTALVLGIIGAVFCWIPGLGGGLAVLAVIFGGLGYARARRGEANNPGMAIAGLVLGVVAFLIQVVVTAAIGSAASQLSATSPTSPDLSVSAANTPSVTDSAMPAVGDFRVEIRTLSKQCFGDAGCIITYQVDPTYVGASQLSPWKTYRVVYEVSGGENGPQVNNFTVTGGQARFPQQETIGTSSSGAALTARVTSVADR